MERQESPSPLVVVLGSLSAACILLTAASAIKSGSEAPAFFGVMALVFAFVSVRESRGTIQGTRALPLAILITAFWSAGLWILWRTWRVVGGIYDHAFPHASHDRFWRIAFQLVSLPILALALQILLIALLTWFNRVSTRSPGRTHENTANISSDASGT